MEKQAKFGDRKSNPDKRNEQPKELPVMIAREQFMQMRQRVRELNDFFILLGIGSSTELRLPEVSNCS